MSRPSHIRVRTKDKLLIQDINKKVQAKNRRLRAKGIAFQFDTQPIGEFKTRKEFNQYVEKQRSFLNRSNLNYQFVKDDGQWVSKRELNEFNRTYTKTKSGAVVPKKLAREYERTVKRINKQKQKEKNRIGNEVFKSRGVKTPHTIAERNAIRVGKKYSYLMEFKEDYTQFKSEADLRKRLEDIKKRHSGNWIRQKQEGYRESYIKALQNQLGGVSAPLQEKVSKMSLKKFIHLYYTEDLADIEFIYDKFDAIFKFQEISNILEGA